MNQFKEENKELFEILEMMDEIDKIDMSEEDHSIENLKIPYSDGKRPEPVRWLDQGIQHKKL